MLVELVIHAIAGTANPDEQTMVMLKEKNGERILPIITSTRRATMLMMRKHLDVGVPIPLPLSPADIGIQMMQQFGIKLTRVELTALKDGMFFSRVVAEREGVEQIVDFCQGPDGLVMAAVARCPIFVDEELMDAQYMRPTGANSFALNINTISRQMLEDALKNAVENENYEVASRLRDELAKRTPEQDPPTA
jgi:hypothetical protein